MITRSGALRWAAIMATVFAAASAPQAAVTIANGRYFESVQATCNNASSCNINLTAIPAGKVVVIRNVSCSWSFTSSSLVARSAFFAILSSPSTIVASQNFSLSAEDSAGKSFTRPVFHEQFGALVPAGHLPRVGVNFAATTPVVPLFCSIMGTIQ